MQKEQLLEAASDIVYRFFVRFWVKPVFFAVGTMNPIDPELLSLTNELAKLGGSRKVKLSRISVYIRGINNNISSPVNNVNYISFIEENNQIIIRHPSSANDMRCYDISKYFSPSISNERVSADIVNKITTSVFDGFNINLITYGSTNTGKSQLLFGSSSDNMQYDSCEGLLRIFG